MSQAVPRFPTGLLYVPAYLLAHLPRRMFVPGRRFALAERLQTLVVSTVSTTKDLNVDHRTYKIFRNFFTTYLMR